VSRGGSHRLGLLQYDSEVETLLGLTDRLDRFESVVDDMKKRGTTAIYSSIVQAVRMLEPVFESSEGSIADLRVLVLTDGQNNSGTSAQVALSAANRIGAVVDAIIVGDDPDSDLRKIVAATGGQCFQIRSLGAGFELLEAEAVVSLRARRGGADKPVFVPRAAVDFEGLAEVTISTSGAAAKDKTSSAAPRVARVTAAIATAPAPADTAGTSGTAIKRALLELGKVAAGKEDVWMHSGEGVHIFPAEADLTFWRALIEAPAGSPFEGGVFALSVRLPHDYPFSPPNIRFETAVYHCNISDSGQICLDILQEKWNPALTVPKALEAVRILLANPDTDNALRQWIAELTVANKRHGDGDSRYIDEARARTAKDAARSVAEWTAEWGCATTSAPSVAIS